MFTASPTLNIGPQNKEPKQTMTLVILMAMLVLEFIFISSSFNEIPKDSKIVYAEKAPTSNIGLTHLLNNSYNSRLKLG